MKEFLDGNEIAESTFCEKLRTLEIERKIVNKPSKKGSSFFFPKSNSYTTLNASNISYNHFTRSTPSCLQDLHGHSQNLKEVPQNFTEALTLTTSQLMMPYRETNIAKKKKLEFYSNH